MRGTILILTGALCAPFISPAHAQQDPNERVARVEVRPNAVSVRVGERVPVAVVAVDERGEPVSDVRMEYFPRGSGAWYDAPHAEVLGLVPGEETVSIRVRRSRKDGPGFDDLWGVLRVTVLPGRVDRISLTAGAGELFVGTRTTLAAVAYTGDRVRDDVEPSWSSSHPNVVEVTPSGLATARGAGIARVTVGAEGATAQFDVRVVENPVRQIRIAPERAVTRVGDVLHLDATTLDAAGRAVTGGTVEWTLLGSPGQARDAAFVDPDGAFVANDPGTHRVVAAVGSVSALVEVTATPRPPRQRVRLLAHGAVPTGQATTDLWVFEGRDGRDYVYTGTYSGNLMYAWDVTDPGQPTITDSVAFDGRRVNDVKINADASVAIVTSENASNRRNGITVLDVTTPAHPRRLAHYTEGLTGGVHNTWIEGDLVYAVHYGTRDLHIIDISDPASPRRVGRWGLEHDNKWLHDVSVVDGLAYLSYWDDGLVVLDVGAGIAGGTPTNPAFVSQYKYQYRLGNDGQTYGNTHHAIRYGNYVFLGDEIFGCGECVNGARGYIHVVDVSDIRRPREVASYRVPEAGSHNMWAEDGKLYIGYYQAGLRVVDITGELRGDLYRQGREIAWYMTEDGHGTQPFATDTWGAQPYKGKVFASDGASGLWVVELVPAPNAVP